MFVLTGKFNIGTDYDFNYTGYIRFLNRTGEGFMSNLTGNVEVKDMTQSAVIYWGETFTETSDYCSVIIAGKDYDLVQNIGASPALNLGLNITPGSTSIPSGTYTEPVRDAVGCYVPATGLEAVWLLTHEESWNEGGAWMVRTPEACYRYNPR